MKIKLFTPYKGNRHYIQGGDLFNAIQATVDVSEGTEGSYISRLSFSHFAYHECEIVMEENFDSCNKMGEGVLTLPNGDQQSFNLCEGDQQPTERVPYDEEAMVSVATYEGFSATLMAPIEHTSIEAIIALTKVLNYRLEVPKAGKWVFGKIELEQRLPSIQKSLKIIRTKSLAGRFSVNQIVIDDIVIGSVQFVVGAP